MKRILAIIGIILIILLPFFFLSGCTDNQRARTFGGTSDVKVAPGQKVISATWKQDSLWYLTRPMRADEQPETSSLVESSSFGLVEGKVVFRESK